MGYREDALDAAAQAGKKETARVAATAARRAEAEKPFRQRTEAVIREWGRPLGIVPRRITVTFQYTSRGLRSGVSYRFEAQDGQVFIGAQRTAPTTAAGLQVRLEGGSIRIRTRTDLGEAFLELQRLYRQERLSKDPHLRYLILGY